VKGSGGAKPVPGIEVESPAAGRSGARPAAEIIAPGAPQPGRFVGLGVEVGATALSVIIGLLSSYLKARVDRKIAVAQIDRNQAKAAQIIHEQINTILKMMMTNPEKTLYTRVYMSSAAISTWDTNVASPEPATSDSSPMIDLTGVGFTFTQLNPGLADTSRGSAAAGTTSSRGAC